MEEYFRFKQFSVRNRDSALKVGTDAVILGAAMTINPADRRLLDVGTGTGVIALMAAQRLSAFRSDDCGASEQGFLIKHTDGVCSSESAFFVEAIDLDAPSADEAAWNFRNSPWPSRLSSICCPLQEFRPSAPYDLIFSNPPFYDDSLLNPDARESGARHTLSLSYRELCSFAADHLCPEGRLSLILPAEVETALLRTAASFGLRPFRLLRIRTTASKPFRRLLAEFSLGPSTSSPLPASTACSSSSPLPASTVCSSSSPLSARAHSDAVSARCLEEELTLQDGPVRTPAYASLCSEFYL